MNSSNRVAQLFTSVAGVVRCYRQQIVSFHEPRLVADYARALDADCAFIGRHSDGTMIEFDTLKAYWREESDSEDIAGSSVEIDCPSTLQLVSQKTDGVVLNPQSLKELSSQLSPTPNVVLAKQCDDQTFVFFFWREINSELLSTLYKYGPSLLSRPSTRIGETLALEIVEGISKWVDSHETPDEDFLAVGDQSLSPRGILDQINSGSEEGILLTRLIVQTAIEDFTHESTEEDPDFESP